MDRQPHRKKMRQKISYKFFMSQIGITIED
jgi:hypothetical protein